ncbi:hypothetical protein CYMTET_55182 [Cymbomonas tetramitiformis]|uniref:Uncharacterized protein n=1 Tax=Cymbomonas tetramitiformis TaxID=36881 RepID=A0AAE0BDX0_9CHLO|nr:hypothetical protein CYMTET_55182 [Cymbomonas tetramitiformis]|eukprot:gene110-160_t
MTTNDASFTLPLPSSPSVAEMQHLLDVGRIPPPLMLKSSVFTITCLTERCPMNMRYEISMFGGVSKQLYELLRYSEDDVTDLSIESDDVEDIKEVVHQLIMNSHCDIEAGEVVEAYELCARDMHWSRVTDAVLRGFANSCCMKSNRERRCFFTSVIEIFDDAVVSAAVNYETTLKRAAEPDANRHQRHGDGNHRDVQWLVRLEEEQEDHEWLLTKYHIMHNLMLEWSHRGLLFKQPLHLTGLPNPTTYDHVEYFTNARTNEGGLYAALWERYQRGMPANLLDALWSFARVAIECHDIQ